MCFQKLHIAVFCNVNTFFFVRYRFNNFLIYFFCCRKKPREVIYWSKFFTIWTFQKKIILVFSSPIPITFHTGWIRQNQSKNRSKVSVKISISMFSRKIFFVYYIYTEWQQHSSHKLQNSSRNENLKNVHSEPF